MAIRSTTTAHEYFGGMVDSYDSLIRRAVPRYEEMTHRLIDSLPGNCARILELGSGTGNLTLRLAHRFPDAHITTVDASPEMIELTRARLEHDHPQSFRRARFITARFEDLEFAPGMFDLVTSCISLHHVENKALLYRRVFEWLAPDTSGGGGGGGGTSGGGTFRFADQLRGGTEANHQHNWSKWLEFCRLPDHCSEEEVQSLLDHAAAHDHYTPLHEHFALLTEAGFVPAKLDCVWRNLIWGIVTADR